MNKRTLWGLGALAFLTLMVLGYVLAPLIDLMSPDASELTSYLVNKGLFAVALLAVLAKWGGLRSYGFKRSQGCWFLLPGAPFIVLAVLVLLTPEATFGLGTAAVAGWILVSIFVAIGEEGVFRGLFWRAMDDRDVLTVSLVTSLLFGAVHLKGLLFPFPWEIVLSQAVFAVGVGMMFAAVRLYSGSLLAPIALHAVFDAGAVVAAGGVQDMFSETLTVGRLLVPGIVFFVWGLVFVLVHRRRRAKLDLEHASG
jgi:membrane protease YdiL (CAAX protease family)